MSNLWNYIQKIYEEEFDLPSYVIDFIACEDILIKSLSGYCNRRISKYYNNDSEYVQNTLLDLLDFNGWQRDLDINPIAIYNTFDTYESFYFRIKSVTYLLSDEDIKMAWNLCKKFYEMKGKSYELYNNTP